MSNDKPLLLVDGSSYLFRAFHALPPLSNSAGEPTGAIYGVAGMLRKLLDEHRPERIAVVFDAPGRTFRSELFEDYKANRPEIPEELVRQIAPLHQLVKALGFPLLCVSGVEADDVIGTLAKQAVAQNMAVVIVTGDKDMAQLVDDKITLLDTMKQTALDAAGVEKKYGVPPERIVDYLALMGDSSDNIPGIAGVGPKTAAKWLQEFGSLDALIECADTIKGRVGEKLRAGLPSLELSRRLATIDCELALELKPEDLTLLAPDVDALRRLYERFGFKTWLQQLDAGHAASAAPSTDTSGYQIILDAGALDAWLKKLNAKETELFAFDTETDSLNYMQAQVVGLSFATAAGEAAYVPLAHDYPGAPEQLDRHTVLEKLRPLLEDPQRPKLGQHLKFDRHILANHGISLRGIRHDTMLESYVLDSTATRHDMDSLAGHYLNIKTTKFEDIAGKGAKQLTFNQVPLEQAAPYAAEDADVTLRLHRHLWPLLRQQAKLQALYQDMEIPLIEVLAQMEYHGVRIDTGLLKQQSAEIAQRLLELEQEAFELAAQPFNLGSPKQLQQILFDKLGLPVQRKTPSGQPSTAEDVLQELALDFPLPKVILQHRTLSKLKGTYTDKLPLQIDPDTGRVHTSYHQAVTSTGRLSSSDPNLQNIPIRTPEGRRIRQAFVAAPGYRILAADYSQIELRIMAHLSGDEGLVQAFAEREDIHRATAAELFALDLEEVDADQRRTAKTINFALLYGMSAFGLARQLSITRPAAQHYMERYFERYPQVQRFLDQLRRQAAEQGYVETVYGRRLYLPEINARNAQRRQAAERTAINAPMQGTAADIIKRAMLAVSDWLAEGFIDARMIMQVHDELVFEVAENDIDDAREQIKQLMTEAAELCVPLEVEVGVGDDWDQAH